MSNLSSKEIKSVTLLENIYGEPLQDRKGEHRKLTLPETTSISQAVFGHMTDSVPPAGIPPTGFMNKTSCKRIVCAKSGETTKVGVTDNTEKIYDTQIPERDHFHAQNPNETKTRNWRFYRSLPGMSALQAIKLKGILSSVPGKWKHDYNNDDSVSKKAKSTSDKGFNLEGKDTPQWVLFMKETTQI